MTATMKEQGAAVRLWDSQWVNIVNAPEVLNADSREDAVNIAVRLTEKAIAENAAKDTHPPKPVDAIQWLEGLLLDDEGRFIYSASFIIANIRTLTHTRKPVVRAIYESDDIPAGSLNSPSSYAPPYPNAATDPFNAVFAYQPVATEAQLWEYIQARDAFEAATKPLNSHAMPRQLTHGDPIALRYLNARTALNLALGVQP